MDLGMGDLTSMICWQIIGFNEELWAFDYYENHNKDIFHYIEWIKDADRIWNQFKVGTRIKYIEGWKDLLVIPDPNQATNREQTSGKSTKQLFEAADLEVQTYWIGEKQGISLAKRWMKNMWIHPDLIELIQALEGYHYKYDNSKGEYKPEPVHTRESHACKALIYFCAYLDEPESFIEKEEMVYIPNFEPNSAGL